MKIIVTGGAGFIGSELSEYILRNSKVSKIIVIDNLSSGYLQRLNNIRKKIIFIKADVKKIDKLNIKKVDWIIHTSALTPLPDNQISHKSSLDENVSQCGAVVDFCLKTGTKNILFLSTSAIYEKTKLKKFSENIATQPLLMYPLSKYLAEKYFESICKSYELNVVSLRLANIYGGKQDYFRKQMPFLGYLIKNSLLKKNLTLYAKGDFKRDYLFIDDLSRLVLLIIKNKKFKNKTKLYEVLNIGSGCRYSVPDLVSLVEKMLNKKIKITWGKKIDYWSKYDFLYKSKIKFDQKLIKEEVKKIVALNLNKVKKVYNWKSKYKIDEGLEKCIFMANKILKIK